MLLFINRLLCYFYATVDVWPLRRSTARRGTGYGWYIGEEDK